MESRSEIAIAEVSASDIPMGEALMFLRIAERAVFSRLDLACEEFGLTSTQYQILCILRESYPGGAPRYQITAKLADRAPDVTRAIDRLVAMGYVLRGRSELDRRLSLTSLTEAGIDLLSKMDPSINQVHGYVADRLSFSESQELARLCQKLQAGG
jgi:DNA-binding MarR family transcriptional regulator